MKPSGRFSGWLYRRLISAYPADFRDEFGSLMESDFRLARRDGTARAWLAALADWLVSMPRQQWDASRQDVAYSLRTLLRAPLFTLTVVLSLALGIGANATVFSFVDSLLLAPAWPGKPAELVSVLRGNGMQEPCSWLDYVDYRQRNHTFSLLAATALQQLPFGRGRVAQLLMAEAISDEYFAVAGVHAAIGRVFAPGQCAGDCPAEAVISDRLWRRSFAADPSVLGRQVPVSGLSTTIIGVAEPEFTGTIPPVSTDVWIHITSLRQSHPALFSNRRERWLGFSGLLKPGVTRADAVADLNRVETQLQREYSYPAGEDRRLRSIDQRGVSVPSMRRRLVTALGLMMALAALLLLVACANVACLVLVRWNSRRREMAMRQALGASRPRLGRLVLTESLLLALTGATLGFGLMRWLSGLLTTIQPPGSDLYTFHFSPANDFRLWAFMLAVALSSGLLCGVLPAWRMAHSSTMLELRGLTGSGRPRLLGQSALVVTQVALSLALLVASAVCLRSLGQTARVNPGFDPAGGIIVPLNLNLPTYAGDEARGRAFYREVEQRVLSLPGVRQCSLFNTAPLAFEPTTTVRSGNTGPLTVALNVVEPAYLSVMSVSLLAGRNFRPSDDSTAPRVALIDAALARALWPGTSPAAAVGRAFRLGNDTDPLLVAGVVAGAPRRSLTEPSRPVVLLAATQRYSPAMNLAVRTEGPPEALLEPVRRAIEAVDDMVSLRRMRTMRSLLEDALWPLRASVAATLSLGLLALLLAAAGIYAVLSYSLARRTREIGIRLAVGAGRAQILGLAARQALSITAAGVALGLPLALSVNSLLAHSLFGVRPFEPGLIASVAVLWFGVALAACVVPALRALRQGPAAIRELG